MDYNKINASDDTMSVFSSPQYSSSKKSLSETEGLTYDQAIDRAGGFGLFQIFSTSMIMICYLSNGYIFYSLTYLELFPDYICPAYNKKCTYKDRCDDKSIPIDWSSDRSLDNWVALYNLECADSVQIGLLGSMYFAGWCIACIVVPRLGDIYGRRLPCRISAIIACAVYLTIVLSKNLNLTIAMFFFLGSTQPGKSNIAYIYMLELIPSKFGTYLSTLACIADGFTTILISLYFRFVSINWIYFQIFGLSMTFVSCFALFFLPESPKYLWSAKKFKEARESLAFIAKFNKKTSFTKKFKFETEIQDEMVDRKRISISFSSSNNQDVSRLLEKLNLDNSNTFEAYPIEGDQLSLSEKKNQVEPGSPTSVGAASNVAQKEKAPSGAIKELFQNRVYRTNLLVLLVLWVVASSDYFLINFQMKYIEGDIYTNTIVSSISEIISYLVTGALYDTIGPKVSFTVSFAIAVIGSIFYVLFGESHKNLITVMILGSKFGISGAFNLVYIAMSLFPPLYSSTVFGIFNVFARLASMLAPQFAEFKEPVPMIIFCIMAGVAGVVSFFIIGPTYKDRKRKVKKPKQSNDN
ncbi:solute carrier family member 5 [Stylonychia lemnae]|uniref:Solute carrier family member 5 n=1 Tax=Stylonychia lemnae TaxID=5949 RepID=A0A078AIF8_STYLE|nr:solute carrier family member 5 [Stylonychia lemnae]|eukprot:CDW81726.1 solute carrier family member 5 [Stylonychia lemnae]